MLHDVPVDITKLIADIEALATFTEPGTSGWTRRAFSPAFIAGRGWLAAHMRAAGLATVVDAAGNLVGRRPGAEALPPIVLGSHTDTVPGAGKFDGMLGVLAGAAVAQALAAAGYRLRHPLEVVDFLAEEPTPFGVSCVGSMAWAGKLDITMLERCDESGRTLAEALAAVGGRPSDLAAVARSPGTIAGYLELHIEQGRVLEDMGLPIAAVQGIVGIRRATLRYDGRPDHAGTTPMLLRRDALAAAAEVVLSAERAARAVEGAVATVGALRVAPNQSNVVPCVVELSVEMRSLAWPAIERIWGAITAEAQAACAARGVALTIKDIEDVAPMQTPSWLAEVIGAACEAAAPGAPLLASGAGHDGSWIGRIAPAGMIFVRSRDGRSHCPEEYSTPADIALGVAALGRALLALDQR